MLKHTFPGHRFSQVRKEPSLWHLGSQHAASTLLMHSCQGRPLGMQNKEESGKDRGGSLYSYVTQKGGSNPGTNLEPPQLDFSTVVIWTCRTGGGQDSKWG